jgi:hypothetical protein
LDAPGKPLAPRVQRPKLPAAYHHKGKPVTLVAACGAACGAIENFPTKFVVGNQKVAGDRDMGGGGGGGINVGQDRLLLGNRRSF